MDEEQRTTLHHVQQRDVEWLKEHFGYIDVESSEKEGRVVWLPMPWTLLLERTVRQR